MPRAESAFDSTATGQPSAPALRYSRQAGLVFLLFAFVYGYFTHDAGWNGNSRFCLTFALVHDGTFAIDDYHETPYLQTGDKSFHNGHYYCDKAVGTSLLAALAYAPVLLVTYFAGVQLSIPQTQHLLTFLTIGLPAAFAVSLMYQLCAHVSGSRRRGYVAALAIGLGTMAFPFSTLFFGHQLAASLVFGAFYLIFQLGADPARRAFARMFLIGLLSGCALITEYTTAVIVVPLIAYYFHALRSVRPWRSRAMMLLPLAGSAIPIGVLLLYNTACFGHPLANAYQFAADEYFRQQNQQGLMGLGMPRLIPLYYLTIDPARGLFLQSPVLLIALPGLCAMLKTPRRRVEGLLAVYGLVSFLLIHSAHYMWWGGWTFGPRYAIPALPLLCLPIVLAPRRWNAALAALLLISIVQMLIVTAQEPLTPSDHIARIQRQAPFSYSPIYSDSLPKLLAGEFTPNLGNRMGLKRFASLAPLFAALIGVSGVLFHRRRIRP
jgi:hypothetical protein